MALELVDEVLGPFDKVCNITFHAEGGAQVVTVYHSNTEQCEWAVVDLTSVLRQLTDTHKLRKILKTHHDHVQQMHGKMWPGVALQIRESKHLQQKLDGNHPGTWLAHKTLPTSGIFALLSHFLSFKFFTDEERAKACLGFSQILATLLRGIGRFNMQHWKCGENEQETTLEIDASGRINVAMFFQQGFWDNSGRKLWNNDLRSEKKRWVNTKLSYSDQSSVSLAEVVAFALDPQHDKTFRDIVQPSVLGLLTRLACLVDANVLAMTSETLGYFQPYS